MDGYDVRTIDDDKIGHVIGEDSDYLIVEHGLLKTKHGLPRTFVEVDDEAKIVRTTLSKQLIHDSPKVGDDIDRQEIAQYYGLADGYDDPVTRGIEEDSIPADRDTVREPPGR